MRDHEMQIFTVFDFIICACIAYGWSGVDAPLWLRLLGLFGMTIGYIAVDQYVWRREAAKVQKGK